MSPERLFTLLELAVVQRERPFFFGRARGVRGQELLWHRKRSAQEAYRQRTRQLPAIVLQLTRNKEC